MVNSKQVTSKIIKDIEQKRYQLRKLEEEAGLTRKERLSRWFGKIERSKEETQEKRMLLFFGLGKELQGDYTRGGAKGIRPWLVKSLQVSNRHICKCYMKNGNCSTSIR